jgi:hypothetical protein
MKAANKGGYKSYKLISTSDPMQSAGRIAKKQAAAKKGAEGPKKSVKGPVRGGPATGKGRPAKAAATKAWNKAIKKSVAAKKGAR